MSRILVTQGGIEFFRQKGEVFKKGEVSQKGGVERNFYLKKNSCTFFMFQPFSCFPYCLTTHKFPSFPVFFHPGSKNSVSPQKMLPKKMLNFLQNYVTSMHHPTHPCVIASSIFMSLRGTNHIPQYDTMLLHQPIDCISHTFIASYNNDCISHTCIASYNDLDCISQ